MTVTEAIHVINEVALSWVPVFTDRDPGTTPATTQAVIALEYSRQQQQLLLYGALALAAIYFVTRK